MADLEEHGVISQFSVLFYSSITIRRLYRLNFFTFFSPAITSDQINLIFKTQERFIRGINIFLGAVRTLHGQGG